MEVTRYHNHEYKLLPPKPGVYRFFNAENTLIYVGKAKSLKSRVSSYFTDKTGHNRKTRKMVSEVVEIEITIVNGELDALLLENSLIKEHQPKYNILLKDDKTFPYILVTNERYPRIVSTRTLNRSQGRYFGPYASVPAMKSVLELLHNLFQIRTCKLSLTKANVESGKYKICLEHHIGRCAGPCEGLQDEGSYDADIAQAQNILRGHLAPVKSYLADQMQQSAEKLEFERAQYFKDKIELLEKFRSKSVIVNPNITDVDVFAIVSDTKMAYISYLKIANGSIVQSHTVEVKKKLEEPDEEIILQVMADTTRSQSRPVETLTNIEMEDAELNIRSPKIGDKKKLVDLAVKNALFYKKQKVILTDPDYYREKRVLEQLQNDLQLRTLPEHIECFDNSNLGGTNPVASMVHFSKGKPDKKEYRHYNIKTVVGPDDFGSMYEIVTRRYKRLVEEEKPLPDLVVIDGGKGQLSAAVRALTDLGLYGKMAVIGIAKRLEEIYYPEDPYPVHISKKSESLKLLQHLRNEAHRFAITFHRQKRSNSAISSQLTDIKGIGENVAKTLLRKYKSVKKVREASQEELSALIGPAKAKLVYEGLRG